MIWFFLFSLYVHIATPTELCFLPPNEPVKQIALRKTHTYNSQTRKWRKQESFYNAHSYGNWISLTTALSWDKQIPLWFYLGSLEAK